MAHERREHEEEVLRALIRLLRALNDTQAHGLEDATVVIGTAEQRAAGMVRDSPLHEKVMRRAQEERLLVINEESATAEALSSATGDRHVPYKFTHEAVEMLRWADTPGE